MTKSRKIQPSLGEQAYIALKQLILQHEIRAGEQLNIVELAEQLQIGRTPLLMAVHRLASEGLVEIVPRKGIFVRAETLASAHELLAARLLIEPYLAKMAASYADHDLLTTLESIVAKAHACEATKDRRGSMTADREFHQTLYSEARNDMLANFAASLLDRSMNIWYMPTAQPQGDVSNAAELTKLLELIKAADPEAVETAMRAHIETVREKYWAYAGLQVP